MNSPDLNMNAFHLALWMPPLVYPAPRSVMSVMSSFTSSRLRLLRRIPGLYTAFFSVLDPHQDITPHWGYYKGFVRYHLGVLIPGNNEDHSCWLRVNGNAEDNAREDKALVEKGEIYYWKNGQGIVFDDNYLHDAANQSNEVRVVFWLDLRRKFPFYLQLYNVLCLWFIHRDSSMKKVRANARVKVSESRDAA